MAFFSSRTLMYNAWATARFALSIDSHRPPNNESKQREDEKKTLVRATVGPQHAGSEGARETGGGEFLVSKS